LTMPDGQVWGVMLNVALRWQFTDNTSARVADVTYQTGSASRALPEVQFVYDATGWHVATSTHLSDEMQAALCASGTTILEQRFVEFHINGSDMKPLSNRGANGCLISGQVGDKGSGTFLWRFGVLLAADAGAHAILPNLPLASQSEIAAAAS